MADEQPGQAGIYQNGGQRHKRRGAGNTSIRESTRPLVAWPGRRRYMIGVSRLTIRTSASERAGVTEARVPRRSNPANRTIENDLTFKVGEAEYNKRARSQARHRIQTSRGPWPRANPAFPMEAVEISRFHPETCPATAERNIESKEEQRSAKGSGGAQGPGSQSGGKLNLTGSPSAPLRGNSMVQSARGAEEECKRAPNTTRGMNH